MNIFVIRHGETDWNVIGRWQGREDIELNENGRAQARNCAEKMKNQKWRAILTSPLNSRMAKAAFNISVYTKRSC